MWVPPNNLRGYRRSGTMVERIQLEDAKGLREATRWGPGGSHDSSGSDLVKALGNTSQGQVESVIGPASISRAHSVVRMTNGIQLRKDDFDRSIETCSGALSLGSLFGQEHFHMELPPLQMLQPRRLSSGPATECRSKGARILNVVSLETVGSASCGIKTSGPDGLHPALVSRPRMVGPGGRGRDQLRPQSAWTPPNTGSIQMAEHDYSLMGRSATSLGPRMSTWDATRDVCFPGPLSHSAIDVQVAARVLSEYCPPSSGKKKVPRPASAAVAMVGGESKSACGSLGGGFLVKSSEVGVRPRTSRPLFSVNGGAASRRLATVQVVDVSPGAANAQARHPTLGCARLSEGKQSTQVATTAARAYPNYSNQRSLVHRSKLQNPRKGIKKGARKNSKTEKATRAQVPSSQLGREESVSTRKTPSSEETLVENSAGQENFRAMEPPLPRGLLPPSLSFVSLGSNLDSETPLISISADEP